MKNIDAKFTIFGALDEDEELEEQKPKKKKNKETYKVITVSLYNDDYQLLEGYLKKLKEEGYHRINKSKIIRYALRNLNLESITKKD